MLCEGRTAIVTGAAGKGMGRSIALTLAREAANVVVNYLTSADEAAAIVEYIEGQGGSAIAVQADVTQKDQCKTLVDAAVKRFRRVDICVVGPGGGWHMEAIDKLDSDAALDDALKELAPIYCLMPLVLPKMYKRTWGRLIAIALRAPCDSPAYAYNVAKAARAHASRAARDAAWGKGVTVNVIGPGPVSEIPTLKEAIEQCERGPAWRDRKNVTPQDIAESVAFLCSDAGSFISGAEVPFMSR